jgi:hypothetical protein
MRYFATILVSAIALLSANLLLSLEHTLSTQSSLPRAHQTRKKTTPKRIYVPTVPKYPPKHILSDSRPFMFLHIGHGGGTFICRLSELNGEYRHSGCNSRGDEHHFPIIRNCSQRKNEYTEGEFKGYTFFGMERAILDQEFCPEIYRYFLFMRNPMLILRSILVGYYEETKSRNMVNMLLHYHKLSMNQDEADAIKAHLPPEKHMSSYPSAYAPFWAPVPGIARSPVYGFNFFDNVFVRYLSGSKAVSYLPFGSLTRKHLKIAKQRLLQFEIVYTSTNVDDHPMMVNKMLRNESGIGWKHGISALENVTNSHVSKKNTTRLDPYLLESLQRVNALDLELFEFATNLFYQRQNGFSVTIEE